MRWILLLILLFNLFSKCLTQIHLTSLSQKSNYFISTDSYGLTWISSVDGVNVYNGLDVQVYRPGFYNMLGSNIQSHFYEDCSGDIWFSTYNALHRYDRDKDDFEVYQFKDSFGTIVDVSYKVLGFENEFIYFRYGDYLGLVDVNTKKLTKSWNVKINNYYHFDAIFDGGNINVVCAIESHLMTLSVDKYLRTKPIVTPHTLTKGYDITNVQWKNNNDVILSYDKQNHVDIYSQKDGTIRTLITHSKNIFFSMYNPSTDILYFNDITGLYSYNLYGRRIQRFWPFGLSNNFNPTPININKDIIYQGIDGKGVLILNPKKEKLNHYGLNDGNNRSSPRSIISANDGSFWFSSRSHGIGHFSKDGNPLGFYHKENGKASSNFVMQIIEMQQGELLGFGGNFIQRYNSKKDRFDVLKNEHSDQYHFIGMLSPLDFNSFLVVDHVDFNHIHLLQLSKNNAYTIQPINIEKALHFDEFTAIYNLDKNMYIVVINSTDVALLEYSNKKAKIIKKFKINTPTNSIQVLNDSILLSADNGLFIIDKNFTNPPRKIIDVDGKLNQNIYCTLIHKDKYFLSSNDGLLMYTPATNLVHRFTKADGIQDLEYNSLAGIKDDDGTMIFGGVNGVNIFHPDSINFLKEPSKIHISKLLINDEPHPSYIHANGVENLNLPYIENTLSFFFNGIDYADMEAIKLKYQLVNYDKHPVALDKNDGLARYANLPPGDYEFNIFATNSDGIWNKEPRIVNITIEPPFWRTWWFRLLVTASALGSGFSLVRSRYKRRLEKQNQLLREQALMIEKQQGIEAERARIASEMHDDLGSGLTTIRFLSEKALKSVNTESEINEIRKIADQSNALVSNMSEIIWALNSRLDNSEELSAYLRRYVGEYLSEHHMEHHFESEGELSTNILTGEKRRNILLVIKEILHNIVKYSGANGVELHIVFHGEKVNMEITELGGVGFDFDSKIGTGNGLYNIQKRIEKLNGNIKYDRTDTGMKISIKIPVENE